MLTIINYRSLRLSHHQWWFITIDRTYTFDATLRSLVWNTMSQLAFMSPLNTMGRVQYQLITMFVKIYR